MQYWSAGVSHSNLLFAKLNTTLPEVGRLKVYLLGLAVVPVPVVVSLQHEVEVAVAQESGGYSSAGLDVLPSRPSKTGAPAVVELLNLPITVKSPRKIRF